MANSLIDKSRELVKLGIKYHQNGDFEKAIAFYHDAIKINQNSFSAYYNRGLTHLFQRKYSQSIEDFDKALKINPKHHLPWNNKGLACFQMGLFFKALHCFTKATTEHPDEPAAWLNQGLALEYVGKPDEAKICYNKWEKLSKQKNQKSINNLIDFEINNNNNNNLLEGSATLIFQYTLRGQTQGLSFDINEKTYKKLFENRPFLQSDADFIAFLKCPFQDNYMWDLLNKIQQRAPSNIQDQARIAINLVQHIPYGKPSDLIKNIIQPYEVLYHQEGVCGDKSLFLGYLLKKIGFGVVLYLFESECHMALGIKCPKKFCYKNSGYAFVETTVPSIVTDSEKHYSDVGKLLSNPKVFVISDGATFDPSEEYEDLEILNNLGTIARIDNNKLSPSQFDLWKSISLKYNLQYSD